MSDDDQQRPTFARRALLRLASAGAALSLTGGVATAQDDAGTATANDGTPAGGTETPGGGSAGAPPPIDPAFGYTGLPDESVPDDFAPDATVQLRTSSQTGAVIGDFAFDPVGLHVDEDAVVLFEATAPEHTVTAYHRAMGRTQRVPEGLPPVSSPVVADGGYWLYRFPEPGVYDLFCASHEFYGMVMRVVVGDQDQWTVVRSEEGRPPFGAAQAVLDQPALDPQAIVDAGRVTRAELDLDGDRGAATPGEETNGTGGETNETGGETNETGGETNETG